MIYLFFSHYSMLLNNAHIQTIPKTIHAEFNTNYR